MAVGVGTWPPFRAMEVALGPPRDARTALRGVLFGTAWCSRSNMP
jgi:hypothetical protein